MPDTYTYSLAPTIISKSAFCAGNIQNNSPQAFNSCYYRHFFIVLSCSVHAVEGSPVISRIQKSGKLLVGTSGNMPLMSEKLMTGGLVGFDIDMAKAACDTMGVELELKTIPFDQLIPALEQGTVDVVLSSMTTAADRNMRVAIASPCFVSGKCLITKEQGIAQTDSPEDLEGADVLFAAIRDSTSSKFYEYPTG